MGLPRREYIDGPKYVCSHCKADVASFGSLVWEGFMGTQQPALLLRRVSNVERASEARRERLTSGVYELAAVRCRMCQTELGWRYLSAASQDQCYKVGCELVRRSALVLILPPPDSADEDDAPATCSVAVVNPNRVYSHWPTPGGARPAAIPLHTTADASTPSRRRRELAEIMSSLASSPPGNGATAARTGRTFQPAGQAWPHTLSPRDPRVRPGAAGGRAPPPAVEALAQGESRVAGDERFWLDYLGLSGRD